MTSSSEVIPAHVGDIVTVVVPNWASAGFRWTAHFDGSALAAVGHSTTAGDDTASASDIYFRFRLLSTSASLQLKLGQPGQIPRQTRVYVIGIDSSD